MGCGSSSTADPEPVKSTQQKPKTVLNNNSSDQSTKTNGIYTKAQLSPAEVTKPSIQTTTKPSIETATKPSIQTEPKSPIQNTTKPSIQTAPKSQIQTAPKNTDTIVNPIQFTKELKFNLQDFQHIDEHARKAPKSVEESVETLAAYLAQPTKNDLERIRAMYVWVCENIRYNTDAYFGGNLSSAATNGEGVLKCKSSVCEGYARLFQDLSVCLGINCKKISGYAKGYRHKSGDIISYDQKTNHAWNVVEVDGVWRFIETTWGAGHVDKNKQFVKQFNDFYFLTPAESFIDDHFPYMDNNKDESKVWQLLKNPITIETYSKIIKRSKEAREFGIEFPTHPYEFISVTKSCSIIVQAKSDVLQKVWCKLEDDKGTYDECIMVLKETNLRYKITVRPKNQGRFQLKINATISNCERNTQLVCYMVDCVSVESDYQPYPKNGNYYGPKHDFIERGFEMSDAIQPFYTCKNGEFAIEVKTSTLPEITTTMYDGGGVDQKNYTLVEQVDNRIYLKARFTKKGYYKLTIFSKYQTDSFSEAVVFLIHNLNESTTTSMFPLTYTTTRKYKCRIIEPLVRDIPANSEVNFKFTCAEFTCLLVNKKKYQKENGDLWEITVPTGESGDVKLSGMPLDGNTYWPVYVFDIKP